MTARDALAHGHARRRARCWGAHDIGQLAPGMCADLALFDLRGVAMAGGAVHDPVAACCLCASPQAAWTIVNGRVVVREGQPRDRRARTAGRASQPAGCGAGARGALTS